MTLPGIEPATFRLVAQCLTPPRVPLIIGIIPYLPRMIERNL